MPEQDGTMSPDTTAAAIEAPLAFARDNADRFERQLVALLRMPSISTQSQHDTDCAAVAEFLAQDMRAVGLENVCVYPTPGHPIVYGDWLHAADAPTVLVYGHYDVQPPDPLDEWRTPPFEPTVVDGSIYARGAADDKGQLYVHLKSVQACLHDAGTLPVNVKFLLEGEEESGSVNLEDFVRAHCDLLRADTCLISDTHMLSAEQPVIISSLRGMAYCEVHVAGPSHDLHSGSFGGAVRNPAEALARMVAQLKDDDGRIAIPGFYDDVVELDEHERELLAQVPFDDAAFMREAGIEATFGERGYSVYEQIGTRPTLEVNGIVSGYTDEGAKTVLPARAMAKISMRLVPNQRAGEIADRFAAHVESLAPVGVSVTVVSLHGGDPSRVDLEAPGVAAAAAALEQVFGRKPVFTCEGGSIPVVTLFDELLQMPTVLMGFGLPDDRLHSPNEKFSLSQFHKGIESSIRFWHELALCAGNALR